MKRKHVVLSGVALAALSLVAFLVARLVNPGIGWGVVLWGTETELPKQSSGLGEEPSLSPGEAQAIDGPKIPSGSLVRVYLKSNIQRLYVVSVPGSKSKAELAQWRLEFFGSKSKAKAYRAKHKPYLSMFALAMRDGLPVREKPENTSKRVYRLKQREAIKIVDKAVGGGEVKSGDLALEGDWYNVLASDGTRGYAFSAVLKMADSSVQEVDKTELKPDRSSEASVEALLAKTWRPEYFRRMIDERRFDLDEFDMRYGLFGDVKARAIRVSLPPKQQLSFSYESIFRLKGRLYGFRGSEFQIQLRDDPNSIVANFPDADGKGTSAVMVQVPEDIEAIRRGENLRRAGLFDAIYSHGSSLISLDSGSIQLSANARFSWDGYRIPGVAEDQESQGGYLVFDRYVDEDLAEGLDGVLGLRFDSADPKKTQYFYYNLSESGLRLEAVPLDAFDPTGLVAGRRGSAALVYQFTFSE